MNCQVIGDADGYIRGLDAIWPGCVHDARPWRNCEEKETLEAQSEFMVAADSAYPISKIIIKPYSVCNVCLISMVEFPMANPCTIYLIILRDVLSS